MSDLNANAYEGIKCVRSLFMIETASPMRRNWCESHQICPIIMAYLCSYPYSIFAYPMHNAFENHISNKIGC